MPSSTAGFDEFLEDIAPFFYRRSLSYVDVGGFVGEMLEKLLASRLKVREAHLIEPNPRSLQAARKRLMPLFKGNSLNFHALAMGEQPGRVRMASARSMSKVLATHAGEAPEPSAEDGNFDAECSTLDLLSTRFTDGRVSLLKIDVEGYEEHVLAGAQQLLQQHKVDIIYIEAGLNPQGTQQVYYRRIEDLLLARGYRLFKIYEQHHEWMDDSPLLRRVNLAFMSSSFAERNPYRLTLELNQVKDELEKAHDEARAAREEAEAQARRQLALDSEADTLRRRLLDMQSALDQQQAEAAAAASQAVARLDEERRARAGLVAAHEEAVARARAAHEHQITQASLQLQRARQAQSVSEKALSAAQQEHADAVAAHKLSLEAAGAEAQGQVQAAQRIQARAERALAAANQDLAREASRREADRLEAQRALEAERATQERALARASANIAAMAARLSHHEARRQRAEESLKEVFLATAEMQRRSLGQQSDAVEVQTQLERVLRSRKYRMAKAAAKHARTLRGWLQMPLAVWRESQALQMPAAAAGAAARAKVAPNSVSLRRDRRTASLALSIKDQEVFLPPAKSDYEVWLRAFPSNPEQPVIMGVQARPSESALFDSVDIEVESGKPVRLEPNTPFTVSLLAGAGRPWLRVPAGQPALVLEIRRLRGELSIVKLELRDPQPVQAAEPEAPLGLLLPAVNTDVESPLTTPQAADAAAQEPTVQPAVSSKLTSRAAPQPTLTAFTSEELEMKLWGGYAPYALELLEQRKQRSAVSAREREDAAWYLLRWYLVEGDVKRALENAQLTRKIARRPHRRLALAEAQCLVQLGRYAEAEAVLVHAISEWPEKSRDYQIYRSTVIRRQELEKGTPMDRTEALQLETINVLYKRVGMAPIEKKDPTRPLDLSNIVAIAQPTQLEQSRKVSVVIPTYNAEESIEAVIDSLLRQTWRNLEVIVVDDCSTDGTCERVDRLTAVDDRVRLVRKTVNEGAYPTRNAGARLATGHFITVHDSDDWSHPQKIETQIAWLDAAPSAVAVTSHWVRVGENLEIVGPWIAKGSMFDVNFSSLLFERQRLEVTGLWDPVKISGDAEFVYRLRRMYGDDCIAKVSSTHLLSLSMVREDSLTRAKATHLRSLFYGLRWNYRDAYLAWLGQDAAAKNAHPVDPETGRRRFPAPLGIRPGRMAAHGVDLVVIADFAEPGEDLMNALNCLLAAAKSGQVVAALHWRRFERTGREPLQAAFYAACVAHHIEICSPGDRIHAHCLLICDPVLLQYKIQPAPEIQADKVVVLVGELPQPSTRKGVPPFDPLVAQGHLIAIFGSAGIWVPQSTALRHAMQAAQTWPETSDQDWLPMIDFAAFSARPIAWRGGLGTMPTVGRHGSAMASDWPTDVTSLRLGLGVDQGWPLRVMGAVEPAASLLGERPAHWWVVPEDTASADFLADLDFYVHHPADSQVPRVTHGLMEAMAAGLPAVLPPALEPVFGTAATYARPEEVVALIEALWTSQARYLALAMAAREFARQHNDLAAFSRRLDRLAPAVPSARAPVEVAPRALAASTA
jgi:FkbM family methyltransferase